MHETTAPTSAPAAMTDAPAEIIAANMKAGQPNAETHKVPETTGEAASKQLTPDPGETAGKKDVPR